MRPAFAAVLAFVVGCAGMTMDEDAAVERGRANSKDKNYRVATITPELLGKLAKERTAQETTDRDPLTGTTPKQYTIAPFDVLQVTVWEHPELTSPGGQVLTSPSGSPDSLMTAAAASPNGNPVEADGTMYYPHVGVVSVAGKTPAEVRVLLTERLARVVVNPQLNVHVASFRGKRVQITGEVVQPSAMPLTDFPLRVQDAIAFAKGVTAESSGPSSVTGAGADFSRVTLLRSGKTFRLDLLAFYEGGDSSQNWLLQDGDVIHVGDRNRNRVFVMGEVRLPQAKLMVRRRMTLAEALADTGGLDPIAANVAKIYVIRGDLRAPSIYRLDARSADALILATQFALQPLDVVYVATYELTRWNRVMSQILPTVQVLYDAAVTANIVNTVRK